MRAQGEGEGGGTLVGWRWPVGGCCVYAGAGGCLVVARSVGKQDGSRRWARRLVCSSPPPFAAVCPPVQSLYSTPICLLATGNLPNPPLAAGYLYRSPHAQSISVDYQRSSFIHSFIHPFYVAAMCRSQDTLISPIGARSQQVARASTVDCRGCPAVANVDSGTTGCYTTCREGSTQPIRRRVSACTRPTKACFRLPERHYRSHHLAQLAAALAPRGPLCETTLPYATPKRRCAWPCSSDDDDKASAPYAKPKEKKRPLVPLVFLLLL